MQMTRSRHRTERTWCLNLAVWDWSRLLIWNAHLGLLYVKERNFYLLYTSGVFLLELLSLTSLIQAFFIFWLVCPLKGETGLFLSVSCDKQTVLKLMLAGYTLKIKWYCTYAQSSGRTSGRERRRNNATQEILHMLPGLDVFGDV